MSSDSRALQGATPRPPRPFQLIVMVDADTNRAVRRRQGTGKKKVSRSEVGYQLLTKALASEGDTEDQEQLSQSSA